MVTAHRQPDGSEAITCAFENLHASGPLIWGGHYKCFKHNQKLVQRRSDDTLIIGRVRGHVPTAYEIAKLTANADDLSWLGLSEAEARSINTAELTTRIKRVIATAAVEAGISEAEMAAQVALAQKTLERADDPGYAPRPERDWREQTVLDVGGGADG